MSTTTAKSTKSATVKGAVVKKAVVKKAAKFVPPEVEEGTWQDTIVKSGVLKERAAKGDQKAGELLWTGSQEGINDWLPTSSEDASAEGLYQTLLTLLGKSRKGDASKITKVAVAVKDKGLVLSSWKNLSQAYGEAKRLIDAAPEHDREDTAAEELAATIAESAPKSTSSLEGAAQKVIGAGVDEASRVLVATVIDAAGSYDKAEPVLRALLRAMSQEIAGVKPKTAPKVKAAPTPKGDTVTKASVKPASEKAKAAPAKATKAKPKPVEVEADLFDDEADAPEIDSELDDLLDDEIETEVAVEEVAVEEAPVEETAVKTKAKPVVRRR